MWKYFLVVNPILYRLWCSYTAVSFVLTLHHRHFTCRDKFISEWNGFRNTDVNLRVKSSLKALAVNTMQKKLIIWTAVLLWGSISGSTVPLCYHRAHYATAPLWILLKKKKKTLLTCSTRFSIVRLILGQMNPAENDTAAVCWRK